MLGILGSIADTRSLVAITCSCTTIYKISIEAQCQVVPQVLFREIGIELVPEAAAVLQSSKGTWTKTAVLKFLKETLGERKLLSQRWTLADAAAVTRLYHQVKQLATDFASESSHHVDSTISNSELNRFQCAFYRFEMYCNLFGDLKHPVLSLQEQKDTFFSNFSPWENEQLACVYGYLYRLLMPDFNEMAEHNIVCGEMSVDYAEPSKPNYYLEHILSRGIENICSIIRAKGYEEKYTLFYPDYPRASGRFLSEALETANDLDDGRYLEEYTSDEIANIANPYFQDPDTGPFDAWQWAHQWTTRAYFVNSDPRLSLRDWGYVMWDRSSLDKIGILGEDWEEPDAVIQTDDEVRRYQQREASLRRRREIFRKGGRGWWSFEDESRIILEVPESPPGKTMEKEKGKEYRSFDSLEEAKEFLLSLEIQES
ncbi:hypothetical protein B0O99DRAFT_744069 [Bisporella sp. PMI_857]|nr:hypothetical protein B0O99DRAFT_744069 [Bisporella sp. PMI_857]